MRSKQIWVFGGVVALSMMLAAALFPAQRAMLQYRLTGSQWWFNIAVSRSVPKGASLGRLRDVVGNGTPVPVPAWIKTMAVREPERFPDGMRAGDTCIMYPFPGSSRWYFQVRDGRLVNYDPAVLISQPQDHLVARR